MGFSSRLSCLLHLEETMVSAGEEFLHLQQQNSRILKVVLSEKEEEFYA